jgi:hypothetical protein
MPDAHSRGCGGEDPSGLGSFQRHSGTRGREETEIAFPVSEPTPHTPSNSCAAWFGGRGGRWCARNLLVGSSAELRSRSSREKDVMPARIWTCRPKRGQGWPRRPPARRTKTRRRGPESTEPARVPSFREDLQRGPVPELPPKRGRDEATRVLRAAEMGWRSRRWYCVGAGQGARHRNRVQHGKNWQCPRQRDRCEVLRAGSRLCVGVADLTQQQSREAPNGKFWWGGGRGLDKY